MTSNVLLVILAGLGVIGFALKLYKRMLAECENPELSREALETLERYRRAVTIGILIAAVGFVFSYILEPRL